MSGVSFLCNWGMNKRLQCSVGLSWWAYGREWGGGFDLGGEAVHLSWKLNLCWSQGGQKSGRGFRGEEPQAGRSA